MNTKINNLTEEKTSQVKKAYRTPKLHHYGGLAELTQNAVNIGNDSGMGQPNGRS